MRILYKFIDYNPRLQVNGLAARVILTIKSEKQLGSVCACCTVVPERRNLPLRKTNLARPLSRVEIHLNRQWRSELT